MSLWIVLSDLAVAAVGLLGLAVPRRLVETLARPPSFVRYWCLAAIVFGIAFAYAGATPEPS